MEHLKDTYKHKGRRKQLVELLISKGIKDPLVLNALLAVPRHLYFSKEFEEFAYEDKAFPIGEGQTISQPYTVAYQSEKLQVKPGMKVLEIGTGSGYQASILSSIGAIVYSVERQRPLLLQASKLIQALGFKNIHLYFSDGTSGLNSEAPFDRIIVTAGAPAIPPSLLNQLIIGGKMVIPVGDRNSQKMLLVEKLSETENQITELDEFKFVPLLGEFGW